MSDINNKILIGTALGVAGILLTLWGLSVISSNLLFGIVALVFGLPTLGVGIWIIRNKAF
ncbi:MAG: hypothetical protein KGI19_07475 [Thaumarchaeota archaeon]|nr:hypothetical protein [Nitrososphaerota archaeon]MDE1818427.1 hypothetical protein [Nitrososphaerota archaeon]